MEGLLVSKNDLINDKKMICDAKQTLCLILSSACGLKKLKCKK